MLLADSSTEPSRRRGGRGQAFGRLLLETCFSESDSALLTSPAAQPSRWLSHVPACNLGDISAPVLGGDGK